MPIFNTIAKVQADHQYPGMYRNLIPSQPTMIHAMRTATVTLNPLSLENTANDFCETKNWTAMAIAVKTRIISNID
ncbi:MAG: hypothetical protein ACTSP1_12325 [Candidatus Freyarchaeota archaeon]|nr:hypothetical protein [Candidatus Sigynarchaeota archaeon]